MKLADVVKKNILKEAIIVQNLHGSKESVIKTILHFMEVELDKFIDSGSKNDMYFRVSAPKNGKYQISTDYKK